MEGPGRDQAGATDQRVISMQVALEPRLNSEPQGDTNTSTTVTES